MDNLLLNNGQTATFLYEDRWDRPVYELEDKTKVCCVNLNGTYLHTVSKSTGEPIEPLSNPFQPKD